MKIIPKPITEITPAQFGAVKALFFDIDDTFSGGKGQHRILDEAYHALWRLHDSGIKVVPVTGRPAGWCDMITRMWPVTAVVGENGAFYSYLDESKKPAKLVKKYLQSTSVMADNAEKLVHLRQAIHKKFPKAKVPSDQHFREFDLAIDYCEDVPRWPAEKVEELLNFCRAQGATAKLSSIHVNTWYGNYDKWTCVQRVMSKLFHIDPYEEINNVVYIGDSPNDEPFFQRLPFSVGVANIRVFLDQMQHAPAYVTEASGGLGFAELVARMLEARARLKYQSTKDGN